MSATGRLYPAKVRWMDKIDIYIAFTASYTATPPSPMMILVEKSRLIGYLGTVSID